MPQWQVSLFDTRMEGKETKEKRWAITCTFGIVALLLILIESKPSIEIPVFVITVAHEGISPNDARCLLVLLLKAALKVMEGVVWVWKQLKRVTVGAYKGHWPPITSTEPPVTIVVLVKIFLRCYRSLALTWTVADERTSILRILQSLIKMLEIYICYISIFFLWCNTADLIILCAALYFVLIYIFSHINDLNVELTKWMKITSLWFSTNRKCIAIRKYIAL